MQVRERMDMWVCVLLHNAAANSHAALWTHRYMCMCVSIYTTCPTFSLAFEARSQSAFSLTQPLWGIYAKSALIRPEAHRQLGAMPIDPVHQRDTMGDSHLGCPPSSPVSAAADVARFLALHGVDVDADDAKGRTALHYAALGVCVCACLCVWALGQVCMRSAACACMATWKPCILSKCLVALMRAPWQEWTSVSVINVSSSQHLTSVTSHACIGQGKQDSWRSSRSSFQYVWPGI